MAIARFLECKVVATSNITLSGQPQTIDGVSVATGNSVLAVGQTTRSQNGVWTLAAGAWTRDPNALSEQDFLGMTVVVCEGAHADTMWQCLNDPPITVGTTDLAFVQLPNLVDKYLLDRLNAQQLASEVAITDTDTTISIADGQRYKLPDGVLTVTRFRTLLNTGAAAGEKVYFRSEQKGSATVAAYNSLIVKNASGAPILNVLRQGLYIAEFDGTQWRGATPAGMQVFNVKDYGAIGDENITVYDTKTERAAVQRCIDAAATHARNPHYSGAVVYFPPGVYRTDGDALILRRTPYNSPMVYLGAGGNSVTLMNATGIGPAGDVARVETLAEGFAAALALGRPGTDSYLWGGERHLFQDLCFSGKHYGINWDLGDAGVPYGDAVRGSPHFHRCFFSRTYSPGPCVRWRRASRARFIECVVNVSNFLAGTGGFEIVEGSSSFLFCRGGGQLIRSRDSGEISIVGCRAEGGRGIPAWDFYNNKTIHITNTANEGHEERDALYRFDTCRNVCVENSNPASTDKSYISMAGTVPISGATTTLTITHTAAITDAYVAQNKIVRSAGSWFEDNIGYSSRIKIANAATNTGWLNVIEATHDTLWVAETVTNEVVNNATAVGTIYELKNALQPLLTFSAAAKTITRSDPPGTALAGSWIPEGFAVGMQITTTAPLNPGPFTITAVSDTTLAVAEAVNDEGTVTPLAGRRVFGNKYAAAITLRNVWGFDIRNIYQNLRFADLGDQTRYGIEVDANCRDGRVENIHRGASPDILIDPAAYNVTGESHGHSNSASIRRTWWLGRHHMVGLDIEENVYHARVGQPLPVTGLSGLSVREDANGYVGIWFDPTAGSSGWKASRSANETTLTTLQDFHAARFVGPPHDNAQIVDASGSGVVIAKTTSALGDTPLVTFTKPGTESTQSFAGNARVWASGYITIESPAQVQLLGATTADLYGGGLLGVRVSASGVTLGGTFAEHDGQISSAIQVDADGATVTFNFNQGNVHQVTLGGNRTVAFSNLRSGATYVLFLIQDGTGNRTVTWPGTAKFGASGTPVLSTAANKRDAIIGTSDGTNVYFHTISKGF